mgnify:CR=1 FL=1|jgi:hypothetical protein
MIAQSTSASSPSSSTLALKRFLYSHRYHCSSFREKFLRNSIMLALTFEADPHEIRQMKPFDSISICRAEQGGRCAAKYLPS